ncbi:hypothetical protein BDW66DRAFT_124950 [Aspergillus desertorum]
MLLMKGTEVPILGCPALALRSIMKLTLALTANGSIKSRGSVRFVQPRPVPSFQRSTTQHPLSPGSSRAPSSRKLSQPSGTAVGYCHSTMMSRDWMVADGARAR